MKDASPFDRLSAREDGTGLVNLIVDTPKGSRNKFRYDSDLGLFRLGKRLPLEMAFPYDFGFIPSTLAEKTRWTYYSLPTSPPFRMSRRCASARRVRGRAEEKGESTRNDRLVAAVVTPYNPAELASLLDLGAPPTVGDRAFFRFVQREKKAVRSELLHGRVLR
jgi:inorganic pyrophosphatase